MVHSLRAVVLRELGRTDEAIASFQRAIELGADDGNVLAKLAHAQLLIGKNQEAVAN